MYYFYILDKLDQGDELNIAKPRLYQKQICNCNIV